MKKTLILFVVLSLLVCTVFDVFAGDVEKTLFYDLSECAGIIKRIAGRSLTGVITTDDITSMKKCAEALQADRLLITERQRTITERASALGGKVSARQDGVTSSLILTLDELLAHIETVDTNNSSSDLEVLQRLLDIFIPKRSRPLLGALPYMHTNYPPSEPASSPVIKPAFKGGDRSVYAADTAASPEAPLSKEIVEHAQSLQWNPVLIYEWVKNNVETEWYWGSMKGAEETLRQKSGNDADQAALLVALLRAANFPARFVRGTIDFFPGIERAKDLTGLDDPAKIAVFFQKSGIPCKPVISGGGISNFQIEHVWVEAFIPYSNYRGAVVDDQGKIWLGLDSSIKPLGYTRNQAAGVPADTLTTLRDDYLNAIQALSPLDYLTAKLNEQLAVSQPGKSWTDLKDTAVLIPNVLKIIPDSMQFNQIFITGEYQSLPDELKHKLTFTATAGSNELFSITLDTHKLSNKRLALRAEPETVEDQNTIDSFGGLDNTPAYLVRLRPVLILDDERVIVAQDGLPMGADFTLNIDIVTPNGTERISSGQINGNPSTFGVVAQKALNPSAITEDDDAEIILHKEAIGYIERWNKSEDDLAALLGQQILRPTITIATVGGQMAVTTLLDVTHDMQWQGVYLDAGYRRIETIGRNGQEQEFMRISALQGSVLENRIFEDDLKVDSVSTAKVLQQAKANGTPLVSINKTNIDIVLPTLSFDDAVKDDIANAVNQGLTVTIPQNEIAYMDWSGIGFIKENPETGESGWMLSGNVAGGMTAWGPAKWDSADLKAISVALRTPFAGKPNSNPSEAAYIAKIPVRDQQVGVAGKTTKYPLQVKVTDRSGKQVKGASVTFKIKSGGGTFSDNTTVHTTQTDMLGLATVSLILGKKTSANPVFRYTEGNTSSDQYGANIVDAVLDSGTAIDSPFIEYGKPGPLVQLRPTNGETIQGAILSYAGFVALLAEDNNGNSISNQKIVFELGKINVTGSCRTTSYDPTLALLVKAGDECLNSTPTISDTASCKNVASTITDTTSISGAWAGIILGGALGATYPVTASTTVDKVTFAAQFAPSSYDVADCSKNISPESQLIISSMVPTDIYGHSINAARSGSTISIIARQYLIKEGETIATEALACGSGSFGCPKVVGDHTFDTTTDFVASKILYDNIPANKLGNGLFQGMYTLKPGVNTIKIEGSATSNYKRTENSCSSGCSIKDDVTTLNAGTSIQVYGVDIAIKQPLNIMLNDLGRSGNTLKINYSINPASYQAIDALILLYKVTSNSGIKNYEQIDYIPVEKQGSGFGEIARGYRFDENQSYAVRVALNYGSYVQIMSDPAPITFVKGALIPDYNHNRKIDQEDIDRSLNGDNYYFWVNDDDGNGDTEGTGIPGSGNLSWNSTNVDGTRDLIDFFPVYLDIALMKANYPPSVYTYKLHHTTSSLMVVETELDATDTGNYLTDIPTAQKLSKAVKTMITNNGYTLPGNILNSKGVILLEGWKEATSPLTLTVYDAAGEKMSELALNLSISGVEQMFRHKNLIQVAKGGNGPVPAHNSKPGGEPDRFIATDNPPVNFPDTECSTGSNIIVLHGYNVDGQEARGFQSEMFKRLYWSGSKAKFWAVSWYGAETKQYLAYLFTPDYHTNVVNAFDTASALKDFLNFNVKGEVTVMAHSLGNMVVSAMLSDNAASWDNNYLVPHASSKIKNYFMVDAAVAIEAYDGSASQSSDMQHSDWLNYRKSLWASEWNQLFANDDPKDNRTKLTWRNRFKSKPDFTNYYNFYSSGEEVLGTLTLTTPITQILVDNMNQIGSYTWAIQEKLKGGNPISVDIVDNSRSGWGFNLDDYAEKDPYGSNTNNPISFILANSISDTDLKTVPFFKKGTDAALYEPGSIGSTYAANNINRLLANAIPALTLPAGANTVEMLGAEDVFNYDMEINYKNNNKDWPLIRGYRKNWRHSDLMNVSYPYVFNLFDKFVSLGGLK